MFAILCIQMFASVNEKQNSKYRHDSFENECLFCIECYLHDSRLVS